MYDQTQFTSLWMIGQNSIYLDDKSYFDMKEISEYIPEKWILYTQNSPTSFFFGAYDQEAIDEEAQVGFNEFTKSEFVKEFRQVRETTYEKTKSIKQIYFEKFYKKEKEKIDKKPDEVLEFLQKIWGVNNFIMPYYLLTQPQRFYKLEEELKKSFPNRELELISTSGQYLTYISKIDEAIIDFAKKLHDSGESFDEYVAKHPSEHKELETVIDEVGFLNWNILGGNLIDRDYAQKKIEEIITDDVKFHEEVKKMDELTSTIIEREEILKKDTSETAQWADIMGHSSILRFDLQTCILCILKYADNFIKAAQEKEGLSTDSMSSYFFNEILELIKSGKKIDEKILKERQKGFLRVLTRQEVKVYIAEEAHEEIRDLLEFRENEIKNTKEVAGTIASLPDKNQEKISGRAFVLTTAFDVEKEIKDFKKGDILIATQTHPNLVSYMKIASAIVTDEGGITCHAAIVSRELRKPCIIGTSLGSKIFKTGDTVELDLKNGTVKKSK